VIIAETISGNLNVLFSNIGSDPLIIMLIFFGPIIDMPGSVFISIYDQISLGTIGSSLIQSIGFIISPFVAAIIAGRTGDNKGGSFGGWMITAMISAVALGILAFISPATLLYYGIPVVDPIVVLISFLMSGIVNGVFYGAFSLLFTKEEMY
ncbi:unnamed protein product, partial [marine sediment metagenome]